MSTPNFQSPEEEHFACWLEELKRTGIVLDYTYEPDPFVLLDPVELTYLKRMKTKSKPISVKLSDKVIYTTDFRVQWNQSLSDGLFTWSDSKEYSSLPEFYTDSNGISYIEVKPDFDRNNMTRAARIKIAWVQSKFGIHIKLWRTQDYNRTFYPESMLLTPQGADKRRKVNGHLIPLRECVPTINSIIQLCNTQHQNTESVCASPSGIKEECAAIHTTFSLTLPIVI
jgi:hypothetical protein